MGLPLCRSLSMPWLGVWCSLGWDTEPFIAFFSTFHMVNPHLLWVKKLHTNIWTFDVIYCTRVLLYICYHFHDRYVRKYPEEVATYAYEMRQPSPWIYLQYGFPDVITCLRCLYDHILNKDWKLIDRFYWYMYNSNQNIEI